MDNLKKIAVLIDADNTQLSKMEALLHEVSASGRIVVKKAYGNWKKPTLRKWEDEVKRLAIKAEQQFDYVAGKNTTDIAMSIDAMDLLHDRTYDAFVLVSSDSDFTPLAVRLRESGAYIIGAGESKTPEAFKNACDDFILLEYLATSKGTPSAAARAVERATTAAEPSEDDIDEIHNLLRLASDKYQNADGFVNIAPVGYFIKRAKPDFTPRTYGFGKLSDFLAAFPDKYQISKVNKGTGTVAYYKVLG